MYKYILLILLLIVLFISIKSIEKYYASNRLMSIVLGISIISITLIFSLILIFNILEEKLT